MAFDYAAFVKGNVPREAFIKIEQYVDLLYLWNKTISLISNQMTHNDAYAHIADSILLYQYGDIDNQVVDIGSGNGLLGIPLSIITNQIIHLVEINKKKSIFLHEIIRRLSLQTVVLNQDIRLFQHNDKVTYFASKAFTKILPLLNMLQKQISHNHRYFFFKSPHQATEELTTAAQHWHFDHEIHTNNQLPHKAMITIYNIKSKLQ